MTFLSGFVFVSLNQRELDWGKHCTRFALMRNYNSFILIQRKNSPSFHSLYRLAENKTPTTSPGSLLSALQLEPQKFHALSTLMQRPRYKYIKTDAVLIRSHVIKYTKKIYNIIGFFYTCLYAVVLLYCSLVALMFFLV